MLSLRTRQAISPQPLARIAITASLLTRIPPWNSWSAQNNLRVCAVCEKLAEKAVFAAEALESAVSMRSDLEIDHVRTRCAALHRDAAEIVREAFAVVNQSRATRLSREQTRTLTRAILGIFGAIEEELQRPAPLSEGAIAAAPAVTLRRSVEQLRLAVSGLREPSDPVGVLNPCAHIRALKREGESLVSRAAGGCGNHAGLLVGLEHCLTAAEALEKAFGVAPRRTNE